MKALLIFGGVLLGIYLGAEKPDIAIMVWETSMHWLDIGIAFIQNTAVRA